MLPTIRQARLVCLLLLLMAVGALPAFAVDFTAYWQYRANGGDKVDTFDELQQRYTLLLGPSLGYQPTHAITANANLGYSRTEQDLGRGQGRETVETITPAATVSLTNDIFILSVSGLVAENRPSKGSDFTSRSWNTSLGSNWTVPLWPTLLLSYSEQEDYSSDDAPDPFREENQTTAASVDWDLLVAKLFYDFTRSRQESPFQRNQTDSDTHFARLETNQSLWQKRLNVSLAQQFIYSDSENTSFISGDVLSAATNPVTAPNPVDFENLVLQSNPLLGDGNRFGLALEVPASESPDDRRIHLGISVDLREQIREAYVYVDPVGSLTGEEAADLQWDLYIRPLPDSPWQLEAGDIPSDFDAVNNRLVLTLDVTARDVMVVAVVPAAGLPLTVAEFEAVRTAVASRNTINRSHLTSFGMQAQLTRTLSAYGSLNMERIESETGGFETDSKLRSVNGSLAWRPIPFVAPSVSFSETLDEQSGAPDLLNRSYGLTVLTNPLPTVNVTLGATRTDRYEDDDKTAVSNVYSLTSSARIYPDLNSSLFITFSENEQWNDTGESDTSEAFTSRLNLNARLRPSLIADLTGTYRTTSQNGEDSGSNTDTTLSLHYRPSGLLSARTVWTRFWNRDTPDILSFNLNLALVRTQKTQLSLRYLHREADDSVDRFGLTGSWDISRNLSFQTRADYTFAETNTWRLDADLTLRL